MRPERLKILIGTILVVATIAVYWRSLAADFVAWDDGINVYANPHIQGLDAQRVSWMFTDTQAALRYKPLSWLTWAIIYTCGGLNPFGFHLANLVLHCLNTLLVFALLWSLFSMRKDANPPQNVAMLFAAGCGALIWGIHPLRVEPVVWVTGLPYGLSLCFLLISLLFYLRSKRCSTGSARDSGSYWASVIFFLLSALSYPIGLIYPAVLVVLDAFRSSQSPEEGPAGSVAKRLFRSSVEKLPFFLIALLIIAVTSYGRTHTGGTWAKPASLQEFGLLSRAMQAFYIWAYYIWKYWSPVDLSPVYTTLCTFNPLAWPFIASAALVIGLSALLLYKRRQWPLLLALWVAHLLLLIPLLGLTEHPHFPSDRYGFVVGILWSILLGAGIIKLLEQGKQRTFILGGVTAAVVGLGFLSYQQTLIWQNSISLFQYALKKNVEGSSYYITLQTKLGAEYTTQKNYPEALACYNRVLKQDPDHLFAHQSIAEILLDLGRVPEAQKHYNEVVRIDPENAANQNALGSILAQTGDITNAINHFEAALRINPGLASANRNMATALVHQGRVEEAKVYLRKATASASNRTRSF